MRDFLLTLYTAWCTLVFTAWMVVLLPFFTLPYLLGEITGGRIALFFIRVWARLFSWMNQIIYRTEGRQKLDRQQSYIYVCNHNSYLDTPGIMLAVPGLFRPLGKVEIKKVPIFGWFYPNIVVLVDRSSNESRRRSLAEMKEKLRKGISVLIFPEGTMNRGVSLLDPFKDGAFRIAIETQTPLVPMVMLNSRRLMPRERFRVRPGVITTVFLDPIPTAGLTLADVPALRQRAYDAMRATLEARAAVVA